MPIFLKACHSIISLMSNGLMNRDRLDMTYQGGGLEGVREPYEESGVTGESCMNGKEYYMGAHNIQGIAS